MRDAVDLIDDRVTYHADYLNAEYAIVVGVKVAAVVLNRFVDERRPAFLLR